jgi:hypothetical protein
MKLKGVKQLDRDALLGIPAGSSYGGGIQHFSGLEAARLRALIAGGHANPSECQNSSPSIAEFLEFMDEHPGMLAHGYAVHYERPDYRTSLEGLEYRGTVNPELARRFKARFAEADELSVSSDSLYCWYD